MTTAYLTHPRCHDHTMPGHPEHAGRLRAIETLFDLKGMYERLHLITPQPASEDALRRVHTPDHLARLGQLQASTRPLIMLDGDTYAVPDSYEIARLSAGAALDAVDAVLQGNADNALVATRPPGHHALPDRAMGFCLLSNVALAARHAQAAHGLERILIVDYDVHHGNGTQAAFYNDPTVLFISTHQFPFYPGSGAVQEIGTGEGRGATLNVPLAAGYGDDALAQVYEHILWPAVTRFKPELMIVSAGFDGHWDDPLGGMTVTLPGFAHLTRELIRMARTFCEGRIVCVMEGGYSLPAVSHGMLNVAYALLGDETVSDPLGLPDEVRHYQAALPPLENLLHALRQWHRLG